VEPYRREGLRRLGGEVAADPAEVVGSCDRVLLVLPTSDVVAAVLDAVEARLRPGLMVIDTTTGSPAGTEAAGLRRAARGVADLDAMISGSGTQARRGEVVLMVGGDARAFGAGPDLTCSTPSPGPRSRSGRSAPGRG
jgi:3-hydroxyisobutyrate dehydrogenase